MKKALRYRYWRRRLRRILGGTIHYDHFVLAALALVVGVLVGYAALGFRELITLVHGAVFGVSDQGFLSNWHEIPRWRLFLAPVVGGLAVGGLLRLFFANGDRPQGIADVIAANAVRDGRMGLKEGLASAFVTCVSLGVGGSAGREGPVVHLGASLASYTAQKLQLTPAVMRTLLACGVASAVAASFNAPLAGVFFALEVVVGHYAIHTFAPVVIAGVAGTIISRAYMGDFPAFIVPDLSIASPTEFPAFLLLGLAAALAAIVFTKGIVFADDQMRRLKVPHWLLPPIGGLALGVAALFLPEVLGVGYDATDNALKGAYSLDLLILLAIAKIAAVIFSLAFRFAGGVFSPSLFIGAMLGGSFGMIAATAFPDLASTPAVYSIVGMGAVAAAVLGAPISTILIIFELTGDYSITIAVMIAAAVASLASGLLHRRSFFLWQLERAGLDLEGGRARQLLRATRVRRIMDRDLATVRAGAPLESVRTILLSQPHGKLIVTDAAGVLLGTITASEYSRELFEPDPAGLIRAEDICRRNPLTVKADDTLESALEVMEGSGEEHLPVVSDAENPVVVGMLHYQTLLKTYNQALMDLQAESRELRHKIG